MTMNGGASYGGAAAFELPARALEGVRTRRMLAIAFDLIWLTILVGLVLFALGFLGLLTFGLTWFAIPVVISLYPLIALLYNGFTISGWRMATPGMRAMDLEMRLTDGSPTPFLNAAIHAVLFYLSWTVLTPAVLLVCLFTTNKRCLHDIFANVVVTRRRD